MSAIRNSNRRTSRTAQLPYARPAPKKSSWSLTGLLSFFNPLRSRSPAESTSNSLNDSDVEEESFSSPGSPAASLNKRGHQMTHDLHTYGNVYSPQQAPPLSLSSPPNALFEPSPVKNLETVSAQLRESLGSDGVEQLVSLLKQGANQEPEPFRFSSSPSTSVRGNSPFQGNLDGPPFSFGSSAAQLSTPSPRKTLNRNPNGVYRWQGGGSAKAPRSKNRYSSPAFGPSRSAPDRLVLKDTQVSIETPKADTKRRRVGEEALNSSATPSGSTFTLFNGPVSQAPMRATAPDPSPTRVKQALPFPVSAGSPTTPRISNGGNSLNANASSSTSRLRIPPLPQKPTVPVIPSPLRQAWSGASPPSHSDTSPITPPSKQTKAANFMTELIKEVTPPKRPDLSNPYQTASPVAKAAPKARVGKRVRATGRPAAPAANEEKGKEKDNKTAEKEKVYSPQAIIEATLPKGSKRSRPPAHFEKASPSRGASPPRNEEQISPQRRRTAYVVEEIDEDDEEAKRATKKSKPHLAGLGTITANGRSSAKTSSPPDIVIEELDDIVMGSAPEKPQSVTSPSPSNLTSISNAASASSAFGRQTFTGLKSTSAPKEPSKLRFSYQPEPAGSPAPLSPPTLTPAPAPGTAPPAPAPFSSTSMDKHRDVEPPKKIMKLAKEAALAAQKHSLPTYTFSATIKVLYSSTSQHVKARNEAKSLPKSSLPSFDFSKQALMNAPSVSKPSTSFPPVKAFDWAAAGGKSASTSITGVTWTCSLCMLSNPDSAVEKCTICEAPRPAQVTAAPPVKAFDWTAAGMKPPTSAGTNWTCSSCMLSNPASATDKCTVCEAPR
ncbi:hypothetical protein D9615_007490 [Tricholomella constricta]|uniref:RanBP2-type domain-containing protein n=1 Tax=Tricholomella constricta TaxID=117010 RepID=A0A8H5GY60_9AGAR|nr:hypothetical protein D9615_007490 [Tricholomella constricta]